MTEDVTKMLIGIVLGWLLSQVGFAIQRRKIQKGELAKAVYFLMLLLDELDFTIKQKTSAVLDDDMRDEVTEINNSPFISRENFLDEAGSACEKISATSINTAKKIRKDCINIFLAIQKPVKELRKLLPSFGDKMYAMHIEVLRASHYDIEQETFLLLMKCDLPTFCVFARSIGIKKSFNHLFRNKRKHAINIDELGELLQMSILVRSELANCEQQRKKDERDADERQNNERAGL